MINSVICVEGTATFQTELVAKRLASLETLLLLTGSLFHLPVVPELR